MRRDRVVPQHREVGLDHLVLRGQVQPDLEQLQRVGTFAVEQREHLGVDDALAGGEPLGVSLAEPGRGAQGIRVIDEASTDHGDRLESAVRVLRESRAPFVRGTCASHPGLRSPGRCRGRRATRRAPALVARRIGVVVVDAEQERVGRLPGKAEWFDPDYDVTVHDAPLSLAPDSLAREIPRRLPPTISEQRRPEARVGRRRNARRGCSFRPSCPRGAHRRSGGIGRRDPDTRAWTGARRSV